jgi:midasin (ATPase involved in ribosome maturation)
LQLITIFGPIAITSEKDYLLKSIEQDLRMRQQQLSFPDVGVHYKAAVLIQGDSGLGKSTVLKAILEKNGFSCDNLDTQRKYYELAVDNSPQQKELLRKKLIQAFHEGAAVILEELNLDKELEILLNQLLSGVDPEGKPVKRPGFMVFASQNPPDEFDGRDLLSFALLNRTHFLHAEKFSDLELQTIAAPIVANPQAFVCAFRKTPGATCVLFIMN